jgi:hypothetical protein
VSDIGLGWGPLDYALVALVIAWPGLFIGAALGAMAWRRHRLWGALIGAVVGFALWLGGFVWWKLSPWG